jgi:recombination protein RecR
MNEPVFLEALTSYFEKLPGVGKKTATRYAYYVIEKMSEELVNDFSKVLVETRKNVKKCDECGMLTNKDVCDICSSAYRNKKQIMIVKDTKDVVAIEKTNQYNGLYHVLGGLIAPLEGIGPDELNISSLDKRITDEVDELIVSTPFTPQGEMTSLYIERIFKDKSVKVSRIGYGLPAGGDIEYVDELTLKRALDSRVETKK